MYTVSQKTSPCPGPQRLLKDPIEVLVLLLDSHVLVLIIATQVLVLVLVIELLSPGAGTVIQVLVLVLVLEL